MYPPTISGMHPLTKSVSSAVARNLQIIDVSLGEAVELKDMSAILSFSDRDQYWTAGGDKKIPYLVILGLGIFQLCEPRAQREDFFVNGFTRHRFSP